MKARLVITLGVCFLPVSAAATAFNAIDPASNAAKRADQLGAAGIAAPAYLVDFEAGFVDLRKHSRCWGAISCRAGNTRYGSRDTGSDHPVRRRCDQRI
jgi:hypothetical protein